MYIINIMPVSNPLISAYLRGSYLSHQDRASFDLNKPQVKKNPQITRLIYGQATGNAWDSTLSTKQLKIGISTAENQEWVRLVLLWLHPNYRSPKKHHRGLK